LRFFYPSINIFRLIVGIFHQRRGAPFSIGYQGIFTHWISRNIFLLSIMYKSTLGVAKKIPPLLMIFFINRDALFSQDNLFPITFFAVYKRRGDLHPRPP
jgi:hypothetical protein